MKQFYFTLLFLSLSLFVSAQENEGKPVKDVTFIKRADDNTPTAKSTSTSKTSITAKSLTTATTPTGSSTEVGTTEGELTVSLSGAANYSIPIAVPAGINGIQPEISLNYNSQRGLKGTAAWGWDIGGISTITRISSTKSHDGVLDSVDYDSLDRFELDGQRLIVKNGNAASYGLNGTVYETEYFSNIKVTSYGALPNGPEYFKVEYPDGAKAYYGYNSDCRSPTDWSITYWENPQGVRINYNYEKLGNSLCIANIKYGALANLTPINEIQFLYDESSRYKTEYIVGNAITKARILKEIKVKISGLGFRNYIIDSPNKYQIKSITEKSGDNTKSYNPTVFEYASTNNNSAVSYLSKDTQLDVGNIDSRNSATVTGDFDEDGKMDLLLYPIYGPNTKKEYFLYTNIESGLNIGTKHPVGAFEDIFATRWLSGNNKVMPQGWTVVTKSMANATAPTDYKFTVYSIGYTTPIYEQYTKNIQFPADMINTKCWSANSCSKTTTYKIFDKKIISGDFNGDGLTDVIAININTIKETCQRKSIASSICEQITETVTSKKVYFIDLKRDLTDYFFEAGELAAAITKDSKVEIGDFNGDGKSDFFIFDNGSVRIYTLSETNTIILLHEKTGDSAISLTKPILIGDYNGDNKYDFIIPKAINSSYWYKYTSLGFALVREEMLYKAPYNANTSYDTYDFVASDYNNDGLTDLIYIQSTRTTDNNLGRVNVGCYENVNGNFTGTATWANSGFVPGINIYALPIYLPQSNKNLYNNVNQISSTLEVAFLNKNKLHFFSSVYDYTKGNLLTKITTGNGVQESIEYVPLDPRYQDDYYNHSIYLPSRTALYPNMDIQINPSFFVVSKVQKQSKDVYKKKLFNYYGAVYNHEGLGFLGFRSVTQTNWHNDSMPVFSTVTKNDIDLRGATTQSFTAENLYYPGDVQIPSNFVSKSITTYNTPVDALQSNKVFKLQMTNAKQFNGLENTTTEIKDIVYDSNNNVTSSTKVISDGTNTHTTINTVSYESPKTTPYIVGRPLVNTESISVSGSTMNSKKSYTYNSKELVSRTESQGNGSGIIYEDNEYDVFGNIVKKTITAPNLTPRETAFEYEPTGRFLTKITDPEKLVTTFVNNPDGTLKSVTNPYSLTTSYTYDPWFKKLTVKDDNLNKTITYNYSKNAEKTVVTTTTDILDGSAIEETFDDLGRKIKSGGKDLNGNFSYTSYLYDIYDRNYMVSEPYFGSSPTQWNETKFDIYNRPIENISFNTRTTSSQYTPNSLISKFIDGQKIKTVTRNAMGNIISMNETTGGTINYSYFANGNLKQIDYNNVKIDIEQDEWGRKSKITDPAAGIFEYKNNALGELTEETSQNGAVKTIITRNDTGKPIRKTVTGPGTDTETTYRYDNTTKLIISSVFLDNMEPVGSNKITTTYNYDDNFKRIQSIIEYKENVSKFTTTFAYDGLGRISSETKKAELGGKVSEITTTNVYKNGELHQIKDNTGRVLWQTNTLNAQGQIVESILGNGIKMTNEYDNNGYLKKVTHDKTSTPQSNIITLTTEFDYKTDNLDSRINSAFSNYAEVYKYDEIARLKEFTNKYGVQENQTYEASGKIKDNNLGTYNYDVAKPYQNTSITLNPETTGYYANREGMYNDSMESRTGWGTEKHPNTNFFSYDDTKVPHAAGKNTLKLSNTTTTEQYVFSDIWIAIDNAVATEYTYSAWVYSDGPETQLFLFMEDGLNTVTHDNVVSNVTGAWTQITKTILVPANVKRIRLRLDNNAQGNAWFDDVQIRKTANNPTAERKLNITYNAFKSPIQIEETGVDKISFSYNGENQRSTMYYGSLADKELRPLRKHYSADGSMEVKQNITTGAIEFVTYIAGDGYGAPIAVKSDGINPSQYLYLHRDYQGTILAITDANAVVVEKRLFDAWGSIIKVQDGAGNKLTELTVLDRGYTGHEHLQSVGLINMNARLYDPMIHRFLGIDNYIQEITNTQNFNNYGYVYNNPLLNTDITGNICEPCGGGNGGDIGVGPGSGNGGSSIDVEKMWNDLDLTKWRKKNLNFKNWGNSIRGWFTRSSGPPPNVSKYGNIQMPTQHSSFGFNWTYLSEGKPGERFIYEFYNGFYTTGQYFIGRSVGDYSMRNLNGSATNTDEAVWGLVNSFSFATAVSEFKAAMSEVKAVGIGWKVGRPITNLTAKGKVPVWSTVRQRFWKNEALFNGSTYSESNILRMQKGLAPQRFNPNTGLMESMELHHHIVPQRNGGLFDFIKVWPDEHRALDPFRR